MFTLKHIMSGQGENFKYTVSYIFFSEDKVQCNIKKI